MARLIAKVGKLRKIGGGEWLIKDFMNWGAVDEDVATPEAVMALLGTKRIN